MMMSLIIYLAYFAIFRKIKRVPNELKINRSLYRERGDEEGG